MEITQSTQGEIEKAWPKVSYKGDTEFPHHYQHWITEVEKRIPVEKEECYLGYDPMEDVFFMGFNTRPFDSFFGEYGQGSMIVKFTASGYQSLTIICTQQFEDGFYSGPYKSFKKNEPNLLDLRLG